MENYDQFIQWYDKKDNDEYNGFEIDDKYLNTKKANQEGKSKYSCLNSLRDHKGRPLRDPSKYTLQDNLLGPYKYVLECGYDRKELEGGSNIDHLKVHNEVFQKFYLINKRYPKYIAEIGFNYGVSACNFLRLLNEKNDEYNVVSFDLGIYDYCFYAKIYTDFKYTGKHILIDGCSTKSVPTFSQISDIKFDIIFIDGDHTFYGAYTDIINCKKISHKDTLVILDNVVPHRGVGKEVYLSFLKALRDNFIEYIDRYEINITNEDYHDGCMVIKYNFNDNNDEKYNSFKKKLDYDEIERKTLSYSLAKVLRDPSLTKDEYIKLYDIIKENINNISDFVVNDINNKYLKNLNNKFNLNFEKIYKNTSQIYTIKHRSDNDLNKSSKNYERSFKSPNRYHKSPNRYHKSPNRYHKSPNRSFKSPNRSFKSPNRSFKSPNRYK